VTIDRQSPIDGVSGRATAAGARCHCHGRPGRLDPLRLARAVEHLVGVRPELCGPREATTGGPAGSAPFAHLDLAAVAAAERSRAAETVCWVLGRCLESGRAGSLLLVAYLDPGEHEAGHLLVAGRGPAVADADACAALSETLLSLYRELELT
jgi:hypothetical protein